MKHFNSTAFRRLVVAAASVVPLSAFAAPATPASHG